MSNETGSQAQDVGIAATERQEREREIESLFLKMAALSSQLERLKLSVMAPLPAQSSDGRPLTAEELQPWESRKKEVLDKVDSLQAKIKPALEAFLVRFLI